MYKEDWVLNNLQWLICHKIKPNLSNQTSFTKMFPTNSNSATRLYVRQQNVNHENS